MEAILHLHPVSAHVLHRRGPDRARNEGHVLEARPALLQGPGHEIVPRLPRSRLHNPVAVGLGHESTPQNLDFEHQGFDLAREHDVAAAP